MRANQTSLHLHTQRSRAAEPKIGAPGPALPRPPPLARHARPPPRPRALRLRRSARCREVRGWQGSVDACSHAEATPAATRAGAARRPHGCAAAPCLPSPPAAPTAEPQTRRPLSPPAVPATHAYCHAHLLPHTVRRCALAIVPSRRSHLRSAVPPSQDVLNVAAASPEQGRAPPWATRRVPS